MSKRPANPYRTVADSAAARYLHCGGWAVSERYPRSGDSEFTPAGKPFATRAHGPLWSTRFAGQIGSLPLVRAIPDQGNGAIQFGSAAYNPAMGDHVRSREYTATAGVWPGHGRRNPGLAGEAALIRISQEFGLTRKGKSRIIGRQE